MLGQIDEREVRDDRCLSLGLPDILEADHAVATAALLVHGRAADGPLLEAFADGVDAGVSGVDVDLSGCGLGSWCVGVSDRAKQEPRTETERSENRRLNNYNRYVSLTRERRVLDRSHLLQSSCPWWGGCER